MFHIMASSFQCLKDWEEIKSPTLTVPGKKKEHRDGNPVL